MKKLLLLPITLLLFSYLGLAQCPVENSWSYGDNGEAEFSHTYYEGETSTIFAIGYFETEITLGGNTYTTPNAGETGKYVAKLDTLGNFIESWQIMPGFNIVGGGASQRGYFEPGAFLNSNEIFVPTTYQDTDGNFVFVVESYDLTGGQLWSKTFQGGPNEYGNFGFDAIDMDGFGNLILTGVFHDKISFDGDQGPEEVGTDGSSTAFVMSLYSFDGFVDVFVPITSDGDMELFGLETDENDGVYISGNSYGATSIDIDGTVTNYSGGNSGFIFKMTFEYETFTGTLDWISILESDIGVEIPALKYEFDGANGSRLHYAAVDYPDDSADGTIVDSKVGALNVIDGARLWEHEMAVPDWYYLAYTSWLDPQTQSIYYPVWAKSGAQFQSELYMDGTLLEDSISSLVIVQKFNTVDGSSEVISPTLYSFIGDVVVLNSGSVYAQSNYTSAGDNVTLGQLNPASYPFFYGYINNSGSSNTTLDAVLEATTSTNAGTVVYQWYKDGNTIAGATDPTYIPLDTGFYSVDIINTIGCNFKTKSIKITEPSGRQLDSLALVDFYQTTNVNDTSWTNTSNWLTGTLDSWHGVTLNPEGTHVESLDLNNNNLYGNIPASIGDLGALKRLHLYSNNLSGNIPIEIGELDSLQELILHTNPLTGNIPAEIGNLLNLIDLRLSATELSGSIPSQLGNLTKLEILYLGFSQYSGVIPTQIGNLTNLRELDLQTNQLEGLLPTELGNLTALQTFVAQGNNLNGEIPASFESLTNLIYIDISENNFSGNFPDIIHLPNIERIYIYNNPLLVTEIPSDLDQLTQLRSYHIDYTATIGGEFPAVIFDATFMESYGLSGMGFTGSLTEADVAQLSNLTDLYINGNLLTGDLPQAFVDLPNLNALDVSNNYFTSLPDFSSSTMLQSLVVSSNQFDIADLLPNAQADIPNFVYVPQRRIGENQDVTPAVGTDVVLSTTIEDVNGANYQWLFNNDSLSGATSANYDIVNFNSLKAGAYVLQASHPDLPELVLLSAFINVKANINASRFYVDNNVTHTADFRDIYQAVSATKEGDTIYVAGSETTYADAAVFSPRIIIGPGYFIEENVNTQYNKASAKTPFLNITKDAGGTFVYGMEVEVIYLNNQSSRLPDTLKNVHLEGNKIDVISMGDKNQNIAITRNFVKRLQINSTSLLGVNRTYNDIFVENNIIDSVSTLFAEISAVENGLNNFNFDFNTIKYVSDSINDVSFNNNIIDVNLSGNASGSGNITFGEANFTNASGSFTFDNDFIPQDNSLDKGAFAGASPYVLSGLPPLPHIYDVVIGPRLSATVSAGNQNGNNINSLRYLFRRNNMNSNAYSASGFDAGQDISVQFLPNRTELEANQNYELVMVAIDNQGKRSHRTYVPYEAIAANLSGNVIDVNASGVNSSTVRLFEINPYAEKYDTAAVLVLENSNNFLFENLILGDYIILADPSPENHPDLLPTYLGNTIDWELAETLLLETNTSGVVIEVASKPEEITEPGSTISGVMFEEYDDADSSLRVLPRRRVSGSGVSVRRLSGSTRENYSKLRLLNDQDLVAYVKTDENGEFIIPNLPAGEYRIQCDYPGVEVDETTDIFFSVSGNAAEEVTVEALVEDGKIIVTETGRVTANKPKEATTFKFYPNPSNTTINMQLENSFGEYKVSILNLNGVVIKETIIPQGASTLDIKELNTGMYLIQLQDEDGNYFISRLIKE